MTLNPTPTSSQSPQNPNYTDPKSTHRASSSSEEKVVKLLRNILKEHGLDSALKKADQRWEMIQNVISLDDKSCFGRCGKQATERCATCRFIPYCSRECQVNDWSKHKGLECRTLIKMKSSGGYEQKTEDTKERSVNEKKLLRLEEKIRNKTATTREIAKFQDIHREKFNKTYLPYLEALGRLIRDFSTSFANIPTPSEEMSQKIKNARGCIMKAKMEARERFQKGIELCDQLQELANKLTHPNSSIKVRQTRLDQLQKQTSEIRKFFLSDKFALWQWKQFLDKLPPQTPEDLQKKIQNQVNHFKDRLNPSSH